MVYVFFCLRKAGVEAVTDERPVKGKALGVPALQQHVHSIGCFEIQMKTAEDLISTHTLTTTHAQGLWAIRAGNKYHYTCMPRRSEENTDGDMRRALKGQLHQNSKSSSQCSLQTIKVDCEHQT